MENSEKGGGLRGSERGGGYWILEDSEREEKATSKKERNNGHVFPKAMKIIRLHMQTDARILRAVL